MGDEAVQPVLLEPFPREGGIPREEVVLDTPELLVRAVRPPVTLATLSHEAVEGLEDRQAVIGTDAEVLQDLGAERFLGERFARRVEVAERLLGRVVVPLDLRVDVCCGDPAGAMV